MKRGVKEFVSLKALRHLLYIPIIILQIQNWFSFLLNYIGFRDSTETYIFRNGPKIKTIGGIDAVTIAVVFIKKAYGDVDDNSTVIDIGANIGVYSIFAATTSKHTTIYAYEPMLSNFNVLLENIRINKLEKFISPVPSGVCARREKRKLYFSTANSPFASLYFKYTKYIEIDCVSLKDIFGENKIRFCDILKLDCEGAEFEILYNTPNEYLGKIKEIRLEYHNQTINKNYNIKTLVSFLNERGFRTAKLLKESEDLGNVWLKKFQ